MTKVDGQEIIFDCGCWVWPIVHEFDEEPGYFVSEYDGNIGLCEKHAAEVGKNWLDFKRCLNQNDIL